MTLGGLLEETATRRGDRLFLTNQQSLEPAGRKDALPEGRSCLHQGHVEVTYLGFNLRVNGLASGLRALGVREGDRVGAILPNSPELVYTWFAVARLGAVLVPLNPALTKEETRGLLKHAGVVLLIGDSDRIAQHADLPGLRAGVTVDPEVAVTTPFELLPFESLLGPENAAPGAKVSLQSPLTILYTSGTTGRPKGCVLTHESYVTPARAFRRWMKVTTADRFFGCLPLFHMAGQAFAASAVAGGAVFVVVSRFSASRFWDQIYHSQATIFRHLGEMLAVLCQRPEHPREREHNLRVVYGGGARRDVVEAFERRFGARVIEGYGLTETNTVLSNGLDDSKPGSIGRMLPYSHVRIADDGGKEAPYGQVGEIQVRRNSVMMKGYLNAPELTEEAFVDGWYRTGDLGYRDRDGYFYFVGRKKDIIRRRGENVAAAEVEEVLNRHPGVALSAVIGVPDRVGGEEIKAFVTPTPGADTTFDSLAEWCRASLAEFKVPRYFEMTPDLPQTPTNKINKGLLRSEGTLGGVRYEVKPRKRVNS